MYSPLRVSTLTRSPGLTNSGTWMTRPVSSVAGLRAPDTRSPCTPGSVSAMVSSTDGGDLDLHDLALEDGQVGGHLLDQVVGGVAERRRRHEDLVVGAAVHEDVVVAVAVEELHVALVDDGLLDADAGVERALEHRAGADVLQLGAHEGPALARLHVLEVDDGEQAVVELQRDAVLQVVGGDRRHDRSFGVCVSGRQPSAVTTTVSSIRTPPSPAR